MDVLLPLNLNPEAHLTFHLITLLRDELYPWFYENFVHLVIHGHKSNIIEFMDNRDETFKFLVDEQITYSFDELKEIDLTSVITKYLSKSFYAAIWVDKYYIPGAVEFEKYHFVHPIFLYGYGTVDAKFLYVNFTLHKGIVTGEITFDNLKKAFDSVEYYRNCGGDFSTMATSLIFIKQKTNYNRTPFHLAAFLDQLKNYLFSQPGAVKARFQWDATEEAWYGIQVYDRLIYVFERVEDGYTIPFKCLNDLVLHKQYLLDRLLYIEKCYKIDEVCANLVHEYEDVVREVSQIKMLNMKYSIRERRAPVGFSSNPEFWSKSIQLLKSARELEVKILFPIYKYLSEEYCDIEIDSNRSIVEYERTNNDGEVQITFSEDIYISEIVLINATGGIASFPSSKVVFPNGEYYIPGIVATSKIAHVLRLHPQKERTFTFRWIDSTFSLDAIDFRIYAATGEKRWNFNDKMNPEWHGINDIRSVNYNPNMCFEVTGKDANIYCRNINLNADLAKFVYIRYKIFGYSRIGQLFYSTCNENLDENHSCIFTVSPNDDMKEYIIDLSDHRDWRGLLSLIRFDPTGYDVREGESVMCELESIEICDRMPVYCSSLCYGRGQGINGWFYYTGNHGITYLEMVYDEKTKRWQCLDNPELWISESEQSSCLNMESVRRFVCQASGTYHIVCDIHPRTSNEKTVFTIKKGHRVVGQYKRDEVSIGNVTFDCCLERGEFLSFEYHNADVNPEVIALNISICKKDDR